MFSPKKRAKWDAEKTRIISHLSGIRLRKECNKKRNAKYQCHCCPLVGVLYVLMLEMPQEVSDAGGNCQNQEYITQHNCKHFAK
jgi:hypothetical protein